MTAHGLIDTTEMYLRTIFELEEEGIVPLRARIAERLQQSGPTVSQTVARMERDGLLAISGDRHLELTAHGYTLAMRVMRKHRLAECLLVDVIGLDWVQVHVEACRWEHVMSEDVEHRLVQLLKHPDACPHGNPIPGLEELGEPSSGSPVVRPGNVAPITELATEHERTAVIRRISEHIQSDTALMATLLGAGVRPGHEITLVSSADGVLVNPQAGTRSLGPTGPAAPAAPADPSGSLPGTTELRRDVAVHVFATAG